MGNHFSTNENDFEDRLYTVPPIDELLTDDDNTSESESESYTYIDYSQYTEDTIPLILSRNEFGGKTYYCRTPQALRFALNTIHSQTHEYCCNCGKQYKFNDLNVCNKCYDSF